MSKYRAITVEELIDELRESVPPGSKTHPNARGIPFRAPNGDQIKVPVWARVTTNQQP